MLPLRQPVLARLVSALLQALCPCAASVLVEVPSLPLVVPFAAIALPCAPAHVAARSRLPAGFRADPDPYGRNWIATLGTWRTRIDGSLVRPLGRLASTSPVDRELEVPAGLCGVPK